MEGFKIMEGGTLKLKEDIYPTKVTNNIISMHIKSFL